MKQIGVNAIANNAITTPKIADNAIVPQLINFLGDPVNVAPQTIEASNVICPGSNPFATGGGFTLQLGSEPFMHASDSVPSGSNAWTAFMYNSHPTETFFFRAEAQCMAPIP